MTGTELSCIRLALGVLREMDTPPGRALLEACDVLRYRHLATARAVSNALDWLMRDRDVTALRVSLALHLRSVLRNALGDAEIEHGGRSETWPTTGRWRCYTRFANDVPLVCSECSEPLGYFAGYDEGEEVTQPCPVTGRSAIARRPRPLWLDARGVER